MKPYYSSDGITIYNGDCRDVLPRLSDSSVDLVVTDPPYSREYFWVWKVLGDQSARVLKNGGSLITLCGHYCIPEILDDLRLGGLSYRWMCILPNHCQPIMHGFDVKVCFKPILWFVRGKIRPNAILVDNFALVSKQNWSSKMDHEWGQSFHSVWEPLTKLASPGDLVLDPFMGSGTTLIGAKILGRRAIGIEVEKRHCETTVRRLVMVDRSISYNILRKKKSESLLA